MLKQKVFLNYKFFSYFIKKLKIGTFYLSGRNFMGRICVHHKCSGKKLNYYHIDFFRRLGCYGMIYKIFKDWSRTGFLGAIIYENGLFSYIILTEGLKIGDIIYSGNFYNDDNICLGSALPIKNFNLFSIINNVENYPCKGSSLLRSAGVSCLIVAQKKEKKDIKM